MDGAKEATPEFEQDLRNLESLNRQFGGHRLVRHFIERWMNPGRCYRVLDLCTGGADVPRMMVNWARAKEITLRIDAVDANPVIVGIARRRCADFPEIHVEEGDVLQYTPDAPYDLVHSSLALHHFGEEDSVRFLRNVRRWTNRWALISDLERHPMTTMGIWLVTSLAYRDPITVHDGRLSAQRAFSYRELRELARMAGWPNFGHRRFMWGRQAIWLDERTLDEVPTDPVGVPIPA
jgi:ubiquinone/menaquinone biosynthesis C-methylase UbiE